MNKELELKEAPTEDMCPLNTSREFTPEPVVRPAELQREERVPAPPKRRVSLTPPLPNTASYSASDYPEDERSSELPLERMAKSSLSAISRLLPNWISRQPPLDESLPTNEELAEGYTPLPSELRGKLRWGKTCSKLMPEIRELHQASFPVHYSDGFFTKLLKGKYPTRLLMTTDENAQPRMVAFGSAILYTDMQPIKGYLATLCVRPEWRRKGLAKTIIGCIEKMMFSEYPVEFVELHVLHSNESAIKLYKSMGYEMIKFLQDHYSFTDKNTGKKRHSAFLYRKFRKGPMPPELREMAERLMKTQLPPAPPPSSSDPAPQQPRVAQMAPLPPRVAQMAPLPPRVAQMAPQPPRVAQPPHRGRGVENGGGGQYTNQYTDKEYSGYAQQEYQYTNQYTDPRQRPQPQSPPRAVYNRDPRQHAPGPPQQRPRDVYNRDPRHHPPGPPQQRQLYTESRQVPIRSFLDDELPQRPLSSGVAPRKMNPGAP